MIRTVRIKIDVYLKVVKRIQRLVRYVNRTLASQGMRKPCKEVDSSRVPT